MILKCRKCGFQCLHGAFHIREKMGRKKINLVFNRLAARRLRLIIQRYDMLMPS